MIDVYADGIGGARKKLAETLWHYNDFGQVKHIERDGDWEGFSYDHRGQLCSLNIVNGS